MRFWPATTCSILSELQPGRQLGDATRQYQARRSASSRTATERPGLCHACRSVGAAHPASQAWALSRCAGRHRPSDASAANIPLPSVMVGESSLNVLGGRTRTAAEAVMNEVARQGLTILYPDPETQTEPLPPTFRTDDDILIFSDSRLLRECSTCTAEAAIGPDELADIITRFYGSEATGQIDPARITSLTFAELDHVPGQPRPGPRCACCGGWCVDITPLNAAAKWCRTAAVVSQPLSSQPRDVAGCRRTQLPATRLHRIWRNSRQPTAMPWCRSVWPTPRT